MFVEIEVTEALTLRKNLEEKGTGLWSFSFIDILGTLYDAPNGIAYDKVCDIFTEVLTHTLNVETELKGHKGLNDVCRKIGEMLSWELRKTDEVQVYATYNS